MESLALLVAILFFFALLSGPVAIGLTKIKTNSFPLTFIRRVFHGLFVAISLWVGMMFFINPDLPITVHLIGLYGLIVGYIAFRREYMPNVRIFAPLLEKFGSKRSSSGDSNNLGMNESGSKSRHGPVMKWRRHGSSGRDGHGPEGQH